MRSEPTTDLGVADELRRELALRRAIADAMLVGVSVVDRTGVMSYANGALAQMVGWSAEELVGTRPPFPYWPPEEFPRIQAAYEATLRGRPPRDGFEVRLRRRNEERFDALVLLSPLSDDAGVPGGWLVTIYDNAARKRAEAAARDNDVRARLALDAGRMGAWEWCPETGEVRCSRELEAIFGCPEGELAQPGARMRYIHPEDLDRFMTAIERAVTDGGELALQARIVRPDGAVRWIEVRGRFAGATSTLPGRLVGVVSDITDRKRLDDGHALLVEASAILSSSLDQEETLRTLARLVVPRMADFCVVHLVGDEGALVPFEVAHVDPDEAAFTRRIAELWPTPPDAEYGIPYVARTGRPFHAPRIEPEAVAELARSDEHRRMLEHLALRSSMVVALEARGRILGTLALIACASSGREYDAADLALAQELAGRAALAVDNARLFQEAERARLAAESSARRLRVLADATNRLAPALDDDAALRELAQLSVASIADYAISYALDPDGTIRRVGLAHRDPDKQTIIEELVRAGDPRLGDRFGAGAVMASGEPIFAAEIPMELLERAAQNEAHLAVLRVLMPRSSIVVPLRARARTIGALAIAATDDSGRRYGREDLLLVEELAGRAALLVDNARLYREAQEAVRARDDMVAAVSHDLRNPLQVILNALSLLHRNDVDPTDRVRTMEGARRAGEQMDRFVRGLLDVARIEGGRLPLFFERVDVRALIDEAASLFVPIAVGEGVRLELTAPDSLPPVRGDVDRLRQVLANVVGNAVKFTPPGGRVSIRARADGGHVIVRVDDTGPGIPPEQMAHLFERFWQAERADARGTGLGLSIAKGIVEAHGGGIGVENRPGEGASFVIRLPIASNE